ncbi:glycoside hydrolase, family 22, partial [Kipferlia bialata]
VNDKYWCEDSKYPTGDCHMTCDQMYDATSATQCAKTVYNEQGLTAWYGYQGHKSTCDNYYKNSIKGQC